MKKICASGLVIALTIGAMILNPTLAKAATKLVEYCAQGPKGFVVLRSGTAPNSKVLARVYNGECGIRIAANPARVGKLTRASYAAKSGWVDTSHIEALSQDPGTIAASEQIGALPPIQQPTPSTTPSLKRADPTILVDLTNSPAEPNNSRLPSRWPNI